MENLFIKQKSNSPYVYLDKNGTLMILGRSHMGDSLSFYEKIHEWIDEYRENPQKETKFIIFEESFNSSSHKQIFKILINLEEISEEKILKIIWIHDDDDDDIKEEGEDMRDSLGFKNFKIIGTNNMEIYKNPLTVVTKIINNH